MQHLNLNSHTEDNLMKSEIQIVHITCHDQGEKKQDSNTELH